jgi:hypothetical protein
VHTAVACSSRFPPFSCERLPEISFTLHSRALACEEEVRERERTRPWRRRACRPRARRRSTTSRCRASTRSACRPSPPSTPRGAPQSTRLPRPAVPSPGPTRTSVRARVIVRRAAWRRGPRARRGPRRASRRTGTAAPARRGRRRRSRASRGAALEARELRDRRVVVQARVDRAERDDADHTRDHDYCALRRRQSRVGGAGRGSART